MNAKVYVATSADLIHRGHLNVLKNAQKYGDVIVGVLTDEAIASYKRLPYMSYEDRVEIISSLSMVSEVVPQNTLDYVANLRKLKPDFIVHGDDWCRGSQVEIRNRVLITIKEWGGKLIEVPYTEGISSSKLHGMLKEVGITPEVRQKRLRRLLAAKKSTRFLEAHNGLTGLIVEKSQVNVGNQEREFDGMWLSSLTDSTAKGKPDIEYVDLTSRSNTLNDILEITTKPIIYDGDSGGIPEHFYYIVRSLERIGVSAVIIEDKIGLKKNSLAEDSEFQAQDSIENFCHKIKVGKRAQIGFDFMVIARIESLNSGAGIEDALARAKAYIDAGADGIMIHSKSKTPDEIKEFCKSYTLFKNKAPLVVVPSTFCQITEQELEDIGVNMIIYANHLLRAAYPAMTSVANAILNNGRALEAQEQCLSIKKILNLIPQGTD